MDDTAALKKVQSVLVVDDTLANLQVLSGMLKNSGYRIRPVPNGRLALQAIANDPPDLILLDISMPDLDGFEVSRQLKQDQKLAQIPIVFISAHADLREQMKALSAGGADYIVKPFKMEEVRACVRKHLQQGAHQS